MFTNISWNNYIVIVVLLLVSWYLFVGLRFYPEELKDIVSRKRKPKFRETSGESDEETDDDLRHLDFEIIVSESAESETIFHEVDGLVKRLKNVFTEATERKMIKRDFEDYMRLVLQEYPLLKDSPYRSSVDELIVSECEKHGSVLLTQPEVEVLWNEKN